MDHRGADGIGADEKIECQWKLSTVQGAGSVRTTMTVQGHEERFQRKTEGLLWVVGPPSLVAGREAGSAYKAVFRALGQIGTGGWLDQLSNDQRLGEPLCL